MRARGAVTAALGCLCCLTPALACATPSPLAVPAFAGPDDYTSGPVLAQRTIDRDWPAPGDSGVAFPKPGERSATAAMAMSMAVPGTGQLYAGRSSGYGYAALEVAGWVGLSYFQRDGNQLRDDAGTVAGDPGVSTSNWSFQRYESSTGADATQLKVLYSADREAFYDAIGTDPRYTAGWNTGASKTQFTDLRDRSDQKFENARWTKAGLWINHLVSAFAALRAMQISNMNVGLPNHVELRAHGSISGGRPNLLLTLERRF
jgi:hypothetical protein